MLGFGILLAVLGSLFIYPQLPFIGDAQHTARLGILWQFRQLNGVILFLAIGADGIFALKTVNDKLFHGYSVLSNWL